jgi:sensor histidine kinase YesM
LIKLILYITLLLTAATSLAQQPVYRHITEDDGLPDNEIYYLYQDSKGIMWISTNSGLCRYNGHSFQYYSSPQLKAKSTGCIKEDVFGRIWCSNFNGQLFYILNDSLVLVQLPGMKNSSGLAPFTIGPQNQLIVTSEQGELAIYKPRHQKKTDRPDYVMDTILSVLSMNPYFATNGILWATVTNEKLADNGITATYSKTGIYQYKTTASKDNPQPGFFFEHNGSTCYFEREKSSLFTFNGKIFCNERKFDLPGFKIVTPLKNGRLAFCTNNGLYISATTQISNANFTKFFQGQIISAFFEDDKENMWVGTLADGLFFIPRKGLQKIIETKRGIDYTNVSTICTGPGNKLILGFLNGELGLLDDKQQYSTLQPANKMSSKAQSIFYSPQLQLVNWCADNIYQSHFSASSTMLKPYRGIGYATKDIAYIPEWNAALVANPGDIQLISLDKNPIAKRINTAWTTHYDTVTFYNKTMPWPQQSVVLSRERGRAVYYNAATTTMWGADKNGLTLYRQNSQTSLFINNEPIYATSLYEHNGIVWVGTFSQGLIAVKNEVPIQQWMVKDGLANNTIYKVIGSGNHLWLTTGKGLQYFDIATKKFYLFDKTLGLPSYKIHAMALVNGNLYISTPKGLLSIADTIIPGRNSGIQVYLRSVYCNDRLTDAANFKAAENNFSFMTELPIYENRALLRYKYRLKGANNSYTITTLDNALFEYKSLQPGNYQFELYLTDATGNAIGKPVYYTFSIRPPFYKTSWFIALCMLLVAALIYWLVRRRISTIRHRDNETLRLAMLETELKQSQLTGIKAQMNPHFMFNALNSIQEFILLNDKRQANMYMGKFADLMRMTLDMSNKPEVLLEDEIKMLELYLELEALRFEEYFSYSISTDDAVDKEHITLPAMLIQPNIENAIKHGLLHRQGQKRLLVHFSMKQKNVLCCTVTDNGIGRKRSGEINAMRQKRHVSFATGATQKRLELLNHGRPQPIVVSYHDLMDEHNNPAGTTVTLTIPLS